MREVNFLAEAPQGIVCQLARFVYERGIRDMGNNEYLLKLLILIFGLNSLDFVGNNCMGLFPVAWVSIIKMRIRSMMNLRILYW